LAKIGKNDVRREALQADGQHDHDVMQTAET
jgi:hypothetical protein